MTIPRDLGSPFNPDDPIERAEFEGFGPDVPSTRGMTAAVQEFGASHQALLAAATAQSVRAAKLFSEDFLGTILPGDDFPTPDPVPPNINVGRRGRTQPVAIFEPGDAQARNRIDVWSFDDTDGVAPDMWPAPTIRVREGDIIHTLMNNSHGPHTIHHHGIEPTPVNDGVGHLTMEVGGAGDGGNYHYQWKAGEAGTYFYHCHRNTVLHFELGMYGMLIIDPAVQGAPFTDGGPGYVYKETFLFEYHKETFWVVDDIDLRWHESDDFNGHDRDFGLQEVGADPVNAGFQIIPAGGLNDFNPSFFVVTGVTIGTNGVIEVPTEDQIDRNPMLPALYGLIHPSIALGQRLLIRALNASYCTSVWRFPVSVDGWVVAVDGRTLGRNSGSHRFGKYSQAFRLSSLPLDQTGQFRQFTLSTAQRWDILIDTGNAGVHNVLVEFRHWLDYDHRLQTAILPITITAT